MSDYRDHRLNQFLWKYPVEAMVWERFKPRVIVCTEGKVMRIML